MPLARKFATLDEHGLPQPGEVQSDDSLDFGAKGLQHLVERRSGVRMRAALLANVVVLTSMQEEKGTKLHPRYTRSLIRGDGPLVV